MKLKSITIATLAALYTAGAASTVSGPADSVATKAGLITPTKLQLPEGYDLHSRVQMTEEDKQAQRVRATFGTNRHISSSASRTKFYQEEGISGQHTYIVQFHEEPVTTYSGGIKNLAATSLRKASSGPTKLFTQGQPLNDAVPAYQDYLIAQHNEVSSLAKAQGIQIDIRRHFTNAINGFSATLTADEAERLSSLPQVKFVSRSLNYELQTYRGPQMIGAGQVWDGTATGVSHKGENIIVGIIDTGINSDHLAFADIGGDDYDHSNPWGSGQYVGDCSSDEFKTMCNDKLIGVRSYPVVTDSLPDGIAKNGEDYQGHGSHTAGTSAGNVLLDQEFVSPSVTHADGQPTGHTIARTSGVAPHANIIAYQACTINGCPGEALLASIEDAISDGVDVINFSISGSDINPWSMPIEMAFLRAHEAGIIVSASAGNSGDGASTAMHASPWLMTVGAATHDQKISLEREVTVTPTTAHWSAPTQAITGKGLTEAFTGKLTTGPTALGMTYDNRWDQTYVDAQFCREPFPAGTFETDEIVICKRDRIDSYGDGIARLQRSDNVAAGGAGGFILYNSGSSDSIVNDAHAVPGIHIDRSAGNDLWNYVARYADPIDGDIMATIGDHKMEVGDNDGDVIAGFSGRGPSRSVPEHLIPSITGPGVDIYAPYADETIQEGKPTGDWTFMSGTSMSAPHLAGTAALVRQAHPDWTVAEVISALMMTAENTVTEKFGYNDSYTRDVDTYVAGSGRVNVDNAVRAGLVLDETPSNFRNANPENGGTVRNLNLAELVNFECSFKGCGWIRQFRATKDGTWSFEAETGENGVKLTANPATFTLKAGESQLVQINANLKDTQSVYGGSDGIEVHARVYFKSQDSTIPDSVLPVALAMAAAELPANIIVNANRNDGRTIIKGLEARQINELTPRVYQPVVATQYQVALPQTSHGEMLFNSKNPYDMEENLYSGMDLQWVNVAQGSKRLMAEVVSMDETNIPEEQFWMAFAPFIHVGIDANQDGMIDYADELVCVSNSELGNRRAIEAQTIDNWCNINDPDAGNYWIIVENAGYNSEYVSTFTAAYGVVSGQQSGDISVTGQASVEAGESFDLNVSYNIEMVEGDRVYSAIDLGSEAVNAGNIGNIALNILRGRDEVSLTASQGTAKAGDIVTLTLDVSANNTGVEREYSLQGVLPTGLKYVENSLKATGQYLPETVAVLDNVITISGIQEDSTSWEARYEMTTNATSEMCHMPHDINPDGGYIDMLSSYGMLPYMGGDSDRVRLAMGGETGDYWDRFGIRIPFSWLYGSGAALQMYNNGKYDPYKAMYIFPTGFIEFANANDAYYTFENVLNADLTWQATGTPYGVDAIIAPFWKGGVFGGFSFTETAYTPLVNGPYTPEEQVSGITLANYNDGRVLVEWDNMRTGNYAGREKVITGEGPWDYFYKNIYSDDFGDNYDMQVLLEVGDYRMGKGEFEFIVAFDNIKLGSAADNVTSGVFGYKGPRDAVMPIEGYKATQHTHNNSAETINDDLVICYDYVGPESTGFKVEFQVEVTGEALGTSHDLALTSLVAGLSDSSVVTVVTVNSNISVYDIADQQIDENTSLTGLKVVYLDSEGDANNISVTGDNVTATVEGNTFSITPDANWHGETEVTVTVADAVYANDAASTSFMLKVNSDGKELGCTDSSATNYDENANTDDGSCSFPQAPETPEAKPAASGGALHYLLGLLVMAGLMRRRLK